VIVQLPASPLAPDVSPVHVYYREAGAGCPLLFLHGGWGYEIYPFDRQIATLGNRFRIVIPDRTGYGQSEPVDELEPDFHQRAAAETLALVDALGLERPVLWGHSDGAVIALRFALSWPDRVSAVVAEATHVLRVKPASRAFFEKMVRKPNELGERVTSVLASDHGSRWQRVVSMNGRAWLRIADESWSADADLYEGRLGELDVPTLVVHGAHDPRTEPGELDSLDAARDCQKVILPEGGHSPHTESATADEVVLVAGRFLDGAASPLAPSRLSRSASYRDSK
jgi:pimeloyl-ACP methyl ester carboxylesterase